MSGQIEIMWGDVADVAEAGKWQEYHLGEVADIQTGPFGSQLHSADYVAAGIPSIMPTNIGRRLEISKSSIAFITEADAQRLSRYLVEDGDIVYSRRGDVEKCAFITAQESGWLCGTGCLRIRFTSEIIYPKFCAYYLSTNEMKGWISSHAVGTTMPNLNSGILKRLPISLPSLIEQQAISGVLSSIDGKIDLLYQQNATLESLAETLFRQWFIEDAKEEWELGQIKDLVNVLSGFPFKSSTFVDSGQYSLITIKAVQNGYLELSNADKLNEIPAKMPGYCRLSIGDILLSLTGNVGRCCLVDNTDLLLNQRVAKMKPKSERDWAFIYVLFRQSSMRATLEELAKGTAQANLSPIETANMEFFIPDTASLEAFSNAATPWIEKVLLNKKGISALSTLRDTLLPKLMSGEVRVAY